MGMGFDPAIFVYRQAILLTQDVNSIPKCSNEYAPLVRAAFFLRRMSALMGQWVSTTMMSGRIELKYSAIHYYVMSTIMKYNMKCPILEFVMKSSILGLWCQICGSLPDPSCER